jgi:intein-encoded DNA endonuclease-like protein
MNDGSQHESKRRKLVRRIKQLRKEGLTYRQVMAKLNREKTLTVMGRKWQTSNLGNFISTYVNQ